jgi:hypothetical protein
MLGRKTTEPKKSVGCVAKGKMELKSVKIALILVISVILTMALFFPVIAADNSYSIRISCMIPTIPGKNVPILLEPMITNTKKQINTPIMFQKDTQETRATAEGKLLLDVETLYSR